MKYKPQNEKSNKMKQNVKYVARMENAVKCCKNVTNQI